MKEFIKLLVPPLIPRILFPRRKNHSGWTGNYSNWAEAMELSGGYDKEDILLKVKNALLEVKNGNASFERDSVLFYKQDYSWSLLAALMWIAASESGSLNILDFGGSLGSTYYQNRSLLMHLPFVKWNVVEQEHFVREGKLNFENEHLLFYPSIKSCLQETEPNTLLLGSVLQYLPNPISFIKDILAYEFNYIIIDRTPVFDQPSRITIQKVPEEIYSASYPAWIFNRQKLLSLFIDKYELIADVDTADSLSVDSSYFSNFYFKKKSNKDEKENN